MLVIGDTIIDQYVFVGLKGRAIKDPILSTEYKEHETYAGGILAIANHLSNYVNSVKLVTILGDERTKLEFIKNSLSKNVSLTEFIKIKSPTTIKKRYVDAYKNDKLFKVEYMNDSPISKELTEEIVSYLDKEASNYDLVVVGDFGHGFINNAITQKLEEKSKYICANVQTNSANMGFNYFIKLNRTDFISLNEMELRLGLHARFEPIEVLLEKVQEKNEIKNCMITLGKKGNIYISQGNIYKSHALVDKTLDTVGAGDAVFAFASLLNYASVDPEILPKLANCAGAVASNIMGNKASVNKEDIIKTLEENQ